MVYAYKEWLIGLGIGLSICLVFLISILTTKQPDFSIRLISDQPVSSETLDKLTAIVQANSAEEILVDIQNYPIGSMEQQQVLMAEVAAKEIDLFVVPVEASKEVTTLVAEMIDEQESFQLQDEELNDYILSAAINSQHLEQISRFKKTLP